jgi:hypothetical protein
MEQKRGDREMGERGMEEEGEGEGEGGGGREKATRRRG